MLLQEILQISFRKKKTKQNDLWENALKNGNFIQLYENFFEIMVCVRFDFFGFFFKISKFSLLLEHASKRPNSAHNNNVIFAPQKVIEEL